MHRVRRLPRLLCPLAVAALGFAACDNPATVPTMDMATAQDMTSAQDMAPSGPTTAVVATADFTGGTGALNTIALVPKTVTKNIDTTLSSNNGVRCMGGKCYVLDETHGTVRVYDPAAMWKSPVEIKTGDATVMAASSNPHDVWALAGTTKIYVVLYGNDNAHAVGVIDTTSASNGIGTWISVPQAAADNMDANKPEANNLWACNGKLYVMLEDLNEGDGSFSPTGPGRIAVIDTTTDTMTSVIQLMGKNPIDLAASDGSACDTVLVADASNQFGAVDGTGGIERVDLTNMHTFGLILSDMTLGGHPSTMTVASTTRAFTVLSVDGGLAQQVVAFDQSMAVIRGDVTGKAGYIAFAKVPPGGSTLWVGVASGDTSMGQLAPGVYAGPADGTMLPSTPLQLDQAPNALSFY